MLNFAIALFLIGRSQLYVVTFEQPVNVEIALRNSDWGAVFNSHGAKWQNGDTLIVLVDTAAVVQFPKINNKLAVALLNRELIKIYGKLKIKNTYHASRFYYQYVDRYGFPAVGLIESEHIHGIPERSPENYLKQQGKVKVESRSPIMPRRFLNAKNTDSSIVIMFNSNSSGWAAIDTLHEIYDGHYLDLEFSSLISERLDDLRTIKPKYIIVVADPYDMTPDFMYDADTTTKTIDSDEYHDAVLSFVTGYGEEEATRLSSAPDGTNSFVLTIANPDGSLPSSGYSGVWLSNYLEDDVNYLGGERLYINTTSSDDPDITAANIASELNNLHRGNVFFNDHGSPEAWLLRDYPGGTSHDAMAGFFSDLKTWRDSDGDGRLDTPYDIENGQNTFAFADACITLRLNGARESAWSPWESSSSNVSSSPINNIALAWMKDSPGFYIGSHSVSYGSAFLKFVTLQIARNNVSPAEALTFSKDIYSYIIGRETTDNNPDDGTTDDYLEYLRHEFMGIGKPTWRDTIVATTSPDYSTDVSALEQQDQLPDNERGYVYTDTPIKWLTTVTFSVNEELVHEPMGAVSEDSMPFTYIFVENVGGNGSSVWADDECAVLADFLYPGHGLPEETDSVSFANGNPGDPDYHLYNHPWYGYWNTEAYEIFKAGINEPDRIILILAAGVTDVDSNGSYEWRINEGYTKQFDVNVFTPPVTDSVIDTNSMGDDHWRQRVVVSNQANSNPVSEVIVSLPIDDSTISVDSVLPSDRVHDVVVVPDSGKGYRIEFTIYEIDSGATDTFEVYYTIEPSRVTEPARPDYEKVFLTVQQSMGTNIIELYIPQHAEVKIEIYDEAGRKMATLANGQLEHGMYRFNWIPTRSGVYTLVAKINSATMKKKFVAIR